MLSDDQSPTTALAAVKGGPRPASAPPAPAAAMPRRRRSIRDAAVDARHRGRSRRSSLPPPPTDRLPVVPLPAQNVLEASPIVTRPRDTLDACRDRPGADHDRRARPSAPSGHEGGYQLQVSSFRTQAEANQFADQLRARSHKAYVVEAHVAGRGTWYRVRVGPFPTQARGGGVPLRRFETREHVVPFIVLPQGKTEK